MTLSPEQRPAPQPELQIPHSGTTGHEQPVVESDVPLREETLHVPQDSRAIDALKESPKKRKMGPVVGMIAAGTAVVAGIAGNAMGVFGGEKENAPTNSEPSASAPVTPGEVSPTAEPTETAPEFGPGIANDTPEHLNVPPSAETRAELMRPVLESEFKTPEEAFNRLGLLFNLRTLGGTPETPGDVVESQESLAERDKLDSLLFDPNVAFELNDSENQERTFVTAVLDPAGIEISFPELETPLTYNTTMSADGPANKLADNAWQVKFIQTRETNLSDASLITDAYANMYSEKLWLTPGETTDKATGTATVSLIDGQWFLSAYDANPVQ